MRIGGNARWPLPAGLLTADTLTLIDIVRVGGVQIIVVCTNKQCNFINGDIVASKGFLFVEKLTSPITLSIPTALKIVSVAVWDVSTVVIFTASVAGGMNLDSFEL